MGGRLFENHARGNAKPMASAGRDESPHAADRPLHGPPATCPRLTGPIIPRTSYHPEIMIDDRLKKTKKKNRHIGAFPIAGAP